MVASVAVVPSSIRAITTDDRVAMARMQRLPSTTRRRCRDFRRLIPRPVRGWLGGTASACRRPRCDPASRASDRCWSTYSRPAAVRLTPQRPVHLWTGWDQTQWWLVHSALPFRCAPAYPMRLEGDWKRDGYLVVRSLFDTRSPAKRGLCILSLSFTVSHCPDRIHWLGEAGIPRTSSSQPSIWSWRRERWASSSTPVFSPSTRPGCSGWREGEGSERRPTNRHTGRHTRTQTGRQTGTQTGAWWKSRRPEECKRLQQWRFIEETDSALSALRSTARAIVQL